MATEDSTGLTSALRAGECQRLRDRMQLARRYRQEVPVSARAMLILCAVAIPLTLAADPPKSPSAEEIASAIRQLGHTRYGVREEATKRLWQAGAAAEPALHAALKSADAEVVRRARSLLDKIEWGIYADTPAEV